VRCGPAYAEILEGSRPPHTFAECKPSVRTSGAAEQTGDFSYVTGIAVSQATGDVYVGDTAGNLVSINNAGASFPPAMTASGRGLLPPHKGVPGDASTTPSAATTAANAARRGVLSREPVGSPPLPLGRSHMTGDLAPELPRPGTLGSTMGTPCVLASLGSGLAVATPGVSESSPDTSTATAKVEGKEGSLESPPTAVTATAKGLGAKLRPTTSITSMPQAGWVQSATNRKD